MDMVQEETENNLITRTWVAWGESEQVQMLAESVKASRFKSFGVLLIWGSLRASRKVNISRNTNTMGTQVSLAIFD
jgi:hypothetical protein